MRPIERVRFFIGPMSKNVVDAVIEFCDENDCHELFGLIPSRRQIDVPAGYSNGWTTPEFMQHVAGRVIVQRDHAGPAQGAAADDGLVSLKSDVCSGLKALHIDPWKAAYASGVCDTRSVAQATALLMQHAARIDDSVTFEVGTEQAIWPYTAPALRNFIVALKEQLTAAWDVTMHQSGNVVHESCQRLYDKVTHIVVQTGVGIGDLQNSGTFDEAACRDMVAVCRAEQKLVKEHNSDYLTRDELVVRFKAGIDAFNFAPEFGVAETKTLMRLLRYEAMHSTCDDFKDHCVKSGKWHRWVSADSPNQVKAYACGHYFFSEPWCVEMIDALRAKTDFDGQAKAAMKERLRELMSALEEAQKT